jgi:putative tryptophan/tyrosine transport system substrate-binding protein
MSEVSRRQFVQGVGLASVGLLAGCSRLPGQAPPRVYRIGRLGLQPPTWPNAPSGQELKEGLRELGYIEGVNFHWVDAFADGQPDRLPELVAALVQEPVDLIFVVGGGPAILAARDATSAIPIVVGLSGDFTGIGVAASLARPGGNVTGLSSASPGLSSKRLEVLHDSLPGCNRIAVLWEPAEPVKVLDYRETEAAAQAIGLSLLSLPVRSLAEFESAFNAASWEHADAFVALGSTLTGGPRAIKQMVDLAAERRLPLMLEPRDGAVAGALLTYGPNLPAMFRRAATYIDKILKGAKPGDLPIEQPMRFDFVINLTTAQALGLTIPQHVLLQATEVIQ